MGQEGRVDDAQVVASQHEAVSGGDATVAVDLGGDHQQFRSDVDGTDERMLRRGELCSEIGIDHGDGHRRAVAEIGTNQLRGIGEPA